MFVSKEFYRGKHISSVENVDHDHVVQLIFETLPKVKADPDWSFSIGRCAV